MRYAWLPWPCVLVALCALSSSAHAFHAATTFADSADEGGGGGIFYTGAPDERGWTCAACHVDAPRKMQVKFVSNLFDGFSYEPGRSYAFTLRIVNERLGLVAPRANYNGFVLRVADAEGAAVDTLTNVAADQFYQRANSAGESSLLATAGQRPGQTEWTFSWIAPAAGRGDVTFYLGVVDGDAASGGPDSTLNDPFGDDLYTARITVHEAGARAAMGSVPPQLQPLLPSRYATAWDSPVATSGSRSSRMSSDEPVGGPAHRNGFSMCSSGNSEKSRSRDTSLSTPWARQMATTRAS